MINVLAHRWLDSSSFASFGVVEFGPTASGFDFASKTSSVCSEGSLEAPSTVFFEFAMSTV